MNAWLDSWTITQRLYEVVPKPITQPTTPAKALPIEHSRYILMRGKKAYKQWLQDQKSAPALLGSLPSGESDPSVTIDCAGADTGASAFTPAERP